MGTKLDANQVLKNSYDEASGSLKTTPSGATSFSVELDATDGDTIATRPMAVDVTTLFSAVAASSNQTSSAVNILDYRGFFVSIVWASLTGTLDGTVVIHASVDDTTYHPIASSSTTLSSANGSEGLNTDNSYYKYFKVVYTKNNISGGTLTVKYTVKG
jgi:hypothetical protein